MCLDCHSGNISRRIRLANMSNISLEQLNALLPRITDAGFDPSQWNDVLEEIRLSVDLGVVSIVGHYFNRSDTDIGSDWSYTTWNNPDELKPYVDHYFRLDPIVPIIDQLPDGRCIRIQEMMPEDKWIESEFYQDFQSLCGMIDFASVKMNGVKNSFYELPIADSGRGGLDTHKVKAINYLAPHIAMAIETNNSLGMKSISTAYGIEGVVEQLGKPSFVLDCNGRIIEANQPALTMLKQGNLFSDRLGYLQLNHPEYSIRFQQQIAKLSRHLLHGAQSTLFRKPQEKSTLSFRTKESMSYSIQISTLPLAITRNPLPKGAGWPAVIVVVDQKQPTNEDYVDLFSQKHLLTPAETEILRQLTQGRGLREAGDQLQRTYNTVRTQLKSIFAKTLTNSQSQLLNAFYKATSQAPSY